VKGRKRVLSVVALGSIVAIIGAACSSNEGGGGGGGGTEPQKGGTYRTAIEDFGFTGVSIWGRPSASTPSC
jgi:hypothetical protein